MKRTTIFVSEGGILMMVREHLAKAPSGNSAQRKKKVKHGWKPEWVAEGRPQPFVEACALANLRTEEEPEVHYVTEDFESPDVAKYLELGVGS